jgi:hypothetical protein
MPFPLAHPAAVLPLRRYCPRWLCFPALVIGSVCPDAGYAFGKLNVDGLSHKFLGSFAFCLPVGFVLLVLFYWLRLPAVRALPMSYQQALLPICQQPRGSFLAIILSLLVGAWTHLLWDSFTHKDGWLVEHLPVLQWPVTVYAGRRARVCHVLWYACSFAGVVWLFVVFEKWKRAHVGGGAGSSGIRVLRDAVLVALLVVPIELVHHLIVRVSLAVCLVAVLCALLGIGIVFKVATARKATGDSQGSAEAEA